MDPENPVVRLCVAVTQAEFAGRLDEARRLAWLAWQAATDDYEACIAAHYVARYQESKEGALHWNQKALACALEVKDSRVESFYPSLYLNMGRALENWATRRRRKVITPWLPGWVWTTRVRTMQHERLARAA